MLKVSHTKPLHDATALMADEAWTQSQQSVHKEARMPEVERPKALSTDAYKWSQKVGV